MLTATTVSTLCGSVGILLGGFLGWLWARVRGDADLAETLALYRAERAEAGRLRQENARLQRALGDAQGMVRLLEVVAGAHGYRAVVTRPTPAERREGVVDELKLTRVYRTAWSRARGVPRG